MSVLQHNFDHTWTALNGKNTPRHCQFSITQLKHLRVFHSFSHSESIFLLGGYISILSLWNVGNKQIPELHYLRILVLPICLTFLPGLFACGVFFQRHGGLLICAYSIMCACYTFLSCFSHFVLLRRLLETAQRRRHLTENNILTCSLF